MKKLTLNKQTISNLSDSQMDRVKSGSMEVTNLCLNSTLLPANPTFTCDM
jgi:hypothetical protein